MAVKLRIEACLITNIERTDYRRIIVATASREKTGHERFGCFGRCIDNFSLAIIRSDNIGPKIIKSKLIVRRGNEICRQLRKVQLKRINISSVKNDARICIIRFGNLHVKRVTDLRELRSNLS